MARQSMSVKLVERPVANIVPGKTFETVTEPAPTADQLKDGEVLVETLYLGLDPAMRGWLRDRRSYLPPVQIGEVMRGGTASRVLASKSTKAKEGDIVYTNGGWREVAILNEKLIEDPAGMPRINHPSDLLSILGVTGLTAYMGMTKIGQPKAGELVVISGAAGATGSIAGQIAKLNGARVVGIAGSDEKCKVLTEELGFDVALNYKAADFKEKFKEATESFIDVYWDNVGGEILDMALLRAQKGARFVMCGAISQYNLETPVGIKNISMVVAMRIHMQGFIVFDYASDYPQARRDLSKWIAEGKIKRKETIIKGGLKAAEGALMGLFEGVNTGKLIVEVKSPDEPEAKL